MTFDKKTEELLSIYAKSLEAHWTYSAWKGIITILKKREEYALIKNFKRRYIEYWLFKKCVEKRHRNLLFDVSFLSDSNILKELSLMNSCYTSDVGLRSYSIKLKNYPFLYSYANSTILRNFRKQFRGITGLNAHVRVVKGHKDADWKDRYLRGKSNFHVDHEFNSISAIIYLSDVLDKDAPFMTVNHTEMDSKSEVKSIIDRVITDVEGLDSRNSSDRIGYYKNFTDVDVWKGSRGTIITFDGRRIIHDGGFPEDDGYRAALFISQKNLYMNIIRKVAKFSSAFL